MSELLTSAMTPGPVASWTHVLVRLIVALLLGRLIAQIYEWTRRRGERTPSFPATLVMLSVLIAMVTQVIGDNVARAFSLVGALSIVRFRTVVRDTEDTAFVIFAVVIGMAIGGNSLPVALVGMAIVTAAAFWMNPKQAGGISTDDYVLRLRVALGRDLEALVGPTLASTFEDARMLSISTAKQGLSLDVSYLVRLKRTLPLGEAVKTLNRLEGIQNVEVVSSRPEMTGD